MPTKLRILGIDPALGAMGWGVVDVDGTRLSFVDCGTISTISKDDTPTRLAMLHRGLEVIMRDYQPDEVAVEESFLNSNAASSLTLGLARGVALCVPALVGLPVVQYLPTKVKKAVVGVGRADKNQVATMVKVLLPKAKMPSNDASDALAVAICHANLRGTQNAVLKRAVVSA